MISFFAFDPAIRNSENGGCNVREWFAARNQFAIIFYIGYFFSRRTLYEGIVARPLCSRL